MLEILILLVILLIVWYELSMFIGDGRIMQIIGLVFGVILLVKFLYLLL